MFLVFFQCRVVFPCLFQWIIYLGLESIRLLLIVATKEAHDFSLFKYQVITELNKLLN